MLEGGPKETRIAPRKSGIPLDFKELYRFRELLYFLVWRDIKVRYKQSALGVGWVLFKPLASMAIFSVIFGMLAKLPSEGVPYPVFVLLGLIPWNYFAGALSGSTNSVVGEGHLISKVYFPRIIVPVGASLSPMLDVLISLALLLAVMAFHGIFPGPKAVFAPVLLAFAGITALGPGLLLSAVYVRYRDVGHIMPFMVQVWMYVTPVIYPVGLVPERYRWLLYLNPMSGVIETFRACFLPGKTLDFGMLGMSVSISFVMLAIGLYFFKGMERTFADVI